MGYTEPSTYTWLIYPDFFCVCDIGVIQGLLKIVNTTSYKKHVLVPQLKSELWVSTNGRPRKHKQWN